MTPYRLAALASGALALAQARRLPPLVDAATGSALPGYALDLPAAYLAAGPFSALADQLAFLCARQLVVWAAWLLLAWWPLRLLATRGLPRRAPREAALYGAYLAATCAFLAWTLWPGRPAPALAPASPEELVLDFHSHTARSHDGRRAFTPAANAAWHRRAGFDAAFVTDHNTLAGAREARAAARAGAAGPRFRSLIGVELSLHGAHVLLLGPRGEVRAEDYQDGRAGLERLLAEALSKHGGFAVLSLPEYWRHHWEGLDALAGRHGAGLEILTASPKALAFPAGARARVLELARLRSLPLVGATDNHGWTSAALVWNVLPLPGHGALDDEGLEAAVLEALRKGGPGAVRVLRRPRREPLPGPLVLLDPLAEAWSLARSLPASQAAACLAWLWAAAAACAGSRRAGFLLD